MNLFFSFGFMLSLLNIVLCKRFEVNQIKFLVCQRIAEEIDREIDKIAPSKKVDVGSYRLDGQGEMKRSSVELRRSELFLIEVIESTCEKMNDYVQATHKSNGELAVIKPVSDGKMNPSLQDFDIVTDGEIHTLKYHCMKEKMNFTRSGDRDRTTRQPLLENSPVRVATSHGTTKYSKLENEIDSPHWHFLDGTLNQQGQLINGQDEQAVMLDDFGTEMENTESKLDSTMKKVAKVLHVSNDPQ